MVGNYPPHTRSTYTGRGDRSGATVQITPGQGPDETDEEKDTGSKIVGRVQDGRLRLQVGLLDFAALLVGTYMFHF